MNKISNGVKKIILLTAVVFALFLLSAKPSAASTWKSPNYPYTADLKVANCTLVNTVAEKDSTHVYTLNPDNTIRINAEYYARWRRNARCDEIQFHVDHNTTITKLVSWLNDVAYGWYKNIGNSHYKNQTVKTSQDEWFYIDTNGAHRIPDILTAWSWGLLQEDAISIFMGHTYAFYLYTPISTPLNFSNGHYASKINNIWKNNNRNFTTLPSRLADEITAYTYGWPKIFSSCPTSCGSTTDRDCGSLLDWRWFQTNPSYPNCPNDGVWNEEYENWRYNDNVWQWEE